MSKEVKSMNLKGIFKDGKKMRIVFVLGIIGVILIFLSTFLPKEKKAPATGETDKTAAVTNEQYEKRYQDLVKSLVEDIAGAGTAQVVVTLESGVEYVYETEENTTADTQNNSEKSFSERNSLERTTLLVEDENGRKQPLLKKTLEPKIRGVVVVCDGGRDPLVAGQITEAVTTALGVNSTRVCVAPLSQSGS